MLIQDAQDSQHGNVSFALVYKSHYLAEYLINRLRTAPVGAVGGRSEARSTCRTQTLTANEHVFVRTVSGRIDD